MNVQDVINLTIDKNEVVRPCPFCNSTDVELKNTWTASYWISCDCGAEMHGESFNDMGEYNPKAHELAKQSTLSKWNNRARFRRKGVEKQ